MTQTNSIINTFLAHFTDDEFLENIAHIYLYHSDVSQNVNATQGEINNYILKFLKDLLKDINNPTISHKNIPIKSIKSSINIIKNIISIRQNASSRLINYNNIFQHFPESDINITRFLKKIESNQIKDNKQFKITVENILQTIKSYYELHEIRPTLKKIDELSESSESSTLPVFNALKDYKNIVIEAYNSLSGIKSLVDDDALSDYFILQGKESLTDIVDETLSYLRSGYSKYKTGYPIIDNNIGGIESNCVTLISGPSNHAKSLFMLNISKNIIQLNKDDFGPNDAVLFITLEDQIFKFSRRLISIFGNYDNSFITQVFASIHSSFKKQKNTDISRPEDNTRARKVLQELFEKTVVATTDDQVKFVFKHADENTMSCSDIAKFIDMLAMNGTNVKALFIDYLDTLIPSNMMYSAYEDYNSQGVITQEMRNLSKQYSIPIVSITQNSKLSLNMQQEMSNEVMGDSFKKVRYADYILMIRLRSDLELMSEQVKRDVMFDDQRGGGFASMPAVSESEQLIPFEIKITKAKDGKRDVNQFHLFSGVNLRIYPTYDEYTKDIQSINNTLESIGDLESLLTDDFDVFKSDTPEMLI